MKLLKTYLALMGAVAMLVTAQASADIEAAITEALASDIRTDADRARDANRKPLETLQFFQLEEDMRVLELLPGGGWYTKLLAPVLAEKGQLYVAVGTQRVEGMISDGTISGVQVVAR